MLNSNPCLKTLVDVAASTLQEGAQFLLGVVCMSGDVMTLDLKVHPCLYFVLYFFGLIHPVRQGVTLLTGTNLWARCWDRVCAVELLTENLGRCDNKDVASE